MPNWPFFDTPRDEGRWRRGVGGPGGAPDRRVRLRLEPAGGGRHPPAHGAGRQGADQHLVDRRRRAHHVQLQRSVDGRRRRALERQDHAPIPHRSRRPPGAQPPRRPLGRARADLRPPGADLGEFPERARPRALVEHALGVQRRQGQPGPGRGGLEAGGRRRARQGRQAPQDALPDLDECPAPEDPADRQAGGGQGRDRDRDQIGGGLGVLRLGRRQPRQLSALLRGPSDVDRGPDAAGRPVLHEPLRLLGDREQGQQVAGAQRDPLAERRVRPALPFHVC